MFILTDIPVTTSGRKAHAVDAGTPQAKVCGRHPSGKVETARANGLEVFSYLQELPANMTQWDHTDEYLEDILL